MKKFSSIFVVFLAMSIQSFAQQFLNIYQDKVVIRQISTEEIDSMSVVEAEPRIISMWKNGKVFLTYTSEEVDSIVVTNQGGDPLSYIGIVGFNDQLYKKEIGILSNSTAYEYRSFVNNLPCKDGTLLYYAVDNALDMLDNANIETPLKNVNLITFTDGLDQGSLMITDKYASSTDYLNAMSNRIARTKVSGHSVNAFSVGLRGRDVTNETLFKQNLQRLASSPSNAFEVSNINELRERFREIANQIISVSNRQTMSVKIPGIDNGTRIRFVFDGYSAENSKLYIEGTFNLQDRSLHDVTYHGLKATSGKTVQGTQDGIFVRYTFTGMRLESGEGLIPTSSVRHYYRLPTATSWQLNSEFKPASDTQTSISHSGTTIFLVLDCSSSLGSDFRRMQQYANEFIDMIADKAEPFYLNTPQNVKAVIEEKNNNMVVNVSWDAVKYAQSYNVYRSNGSSYYADYELIAEKVTSTTWTDSSPLSGYNYYKVCAVNRNNLSSQSSYASVNVKLDAPTNVKAEMDLKNEKFVVNVSWDAVKRAKNYNIYRSSSYNGSYELVAENVATTSWTDNNPLEGNNYYKVCAVNRDINSSQSSYASVNVKLDAPTNVTTTIDDNDLIVHVSWDAVKYAQRYNIYRSSSPNGTYELVAENIKSTTWTDNSPLSGSNHYKVCAVGYGLTSSHSSNVSVNVKLDAPTNVKAAVDDNDLVVNVSWNAVQRAQSYKIYRCSKYNGTYSLVAENVTSTTWTDSSPLSGYNYYKIVAVNRNVTSSQSSDAGVWYKGKPSTVVDLGLPSGTLWASCNVGASKPEEYGGYFAWGETTPQEDYSWSTYKWCNGSSNSLTKYNTQSRYGTVDNKTELDLEDDAAHANWGGDWRMPSLDQIKELEDNCTWEWTTVNGVKGRKATSKINGNSIFLPTAGWRSGTSLGSAGSCGSCWSRSLSTDYSINAYRLYFDSGDVDWSISNRCRGRSVRPVRR